MAYDIIEHFRAFRNKLFNLFVYRASATIELIDAIAGQIHKESSVKLSLSGLFRRRFTSVSDAISNLFRQKSSEIPEGEKLKKTQFEITRLFLGECPQPLYRKFGLYAVDCSSDSSIYSTKMEDRGLVHAPTKVPGQKPITVGHQYSTLVYLPERTVIKDPHWVIPLSTRRVKTSESGTLVGMEQVADLLAKTELNEQFNVLVNDSAYSNSKCISKSLAFDNLVSISRIRNNRVFDLPLIPEVGLKGRGRPKIYGKPWRLHDPGLPDESAVIEHQTRGGKLQYLKIERWYDRLMKDESAPAAEKGKGLPQIAFDAVRVTVLDVNHNPLYKKPLWLMISGKRRRELSLQEIAESYFQRFDIEHFFRFSKQRLLLTSFQTPDVRHEENWWWLCMMSYMMLYMSRSLATHVRNPWEKKLEGIESSKVLPPSTVQRDYERIIGEIGSPARAPKLRGKSPGRVKGMKIGGRKNHSIIKKGRSPPKKKQKKMV